MNIEFLHYTSAGGPTTCVELRNCKMDFSTIPVQRKIIELGYPMETMFFPAHRISDTYWGYIDGVMSDADKMLLKLIFC